MSAVARGRPFQPGQSGNPGGRPRVVAEVRELARAHAPEAITELARLAKAAKSETARIAAIKELLDRGYGKATQYVAAENDERSVKDMNLEELWAGISADLARLFPDYRFVRTNGLKVVTGRTRRPDLSGRAGWVSPDPVKTIDA